MRQSLTKAKIGLPGKMIDFPFNPSRFQRAFGVSYSYAGGAGVNYPYHVFGGGTPPEIIIEDIYLNKRTEGHDIDGFIENLEKFIPPQDRRTQFESPPSLIFAFGKFVKRCKLIDMVIDNTMFDRDLNTIEASIDLFLELVIRGR